MTEPGFKPELKTHTTNVRTLRCQTKGCERVLLCLGQHHGSGWLKVLHIFLFMPYLLHSQKSPNMERLIFIKIKLCILLLKSVTLILFLSLTVGLWIILCNSCYWDIWKSVWGLLGKDSLIIKRYKERKGPWMFVWMLFFEAATGTAAAICDHQAESFRTKSTGWRG